MAEKWYDGLSEDDFKTDTDRTYEKAEAKIRENLEKGMDFDTACEGLGIEDETLRNDVIDDMLKVLIAEEHFGKNIPLEELGKRLKVPAQRLETAKISMIEDVKNTSIKAFYKSLGAGNA